MEDEIFDILYNIYESEIIIENITYSSTLHDDDSLLRPQFLMDKETFINNMTLQPDDYRWNTAFFALYCYKSKENESFKFLK